MFCPSTKSPPPESWPAEQVVNSPISIDDDDDDDEAGTGRSLLERRQKIEDGTNSCVKGNNAMLAVAGGPAASSASPFI